MGVSAASVTRGWRLARAWLHQRLTKGSPPSPLTARANPVTYDPRTLEASGGAVRSGPRARARGARAASSRSACADDPRLLREVEALLDRTSTPAPSARPRPSMSAAIGAARARVAAPAACDARFGSRLGRYEIVSLLGAGGMGEVYRARDPQLGREVGIKILSWRAARSPASSSSASNARRARSARSITRTSSRCTTSAWSAASPTSSRNCSRARRCVRASTPAPLPVGAGARPRAADRSGLTAAHDKGRRPPRHQAREPVRHERRPRQDSRLRSGQADRRTAASQRPRASRPSREHGLLLGTAGYMSPEQVRGRPADARSDVFAFGAVLYEMLDRPSRVHRRLRGRNAERDPDERSAAAPAGDARAAGAAPADSCSSASKRISNTGFRPRARSAPRSRPPGSRRDSAAPDRCRPIRHAAVVRLGQSQMAGTPAGFC